MGLGFRAKAALCLEGSGGHAFAAWAGRNPQKAFIRGPSVNSV